jgi:two-component system NtrC family sensor kinase
MLENRRDNLHRQIRQIGSLQSEGIRKVRLFNKDGRIMFSSEKEEMGQIVDKRAEACFACHTEGQPLVKLDMKARARFFQAPDGTRVLGIISPIPNEPACWNAACHAHGPQQNVLGVLDVNVSMAEADRELAHSRYVMLGLALLAILASSCILWWLNRNLVLRPVRALVAGTRRVAEGDLSTTIPTGGNHELGDLAKAFNAMTHRIAEAQRQLTQADRLASVGRLAAGVAHEINNPLTGVLSFASLLRQRLADDPAAVEDLDVIIRETKRCRTIIIEMLDFARPAVPARKPNDLNEVVRRATSVLSGPLQQGRITLLLDLAPELPAAFLDANQIQQVVLNLLLNARDAMPAEGGEIRIRTRLIQLPALGNAPIRQARCPSGHNLLDPDIRIGGLPAIKLLANDRGKRMIVHLDPVFGRSNHLFPEPMEEGVLATYACPECLVPLEDYAHRCQVCGSPVFSVTTGTGEAVTWCAKKGCHAMTWPSVERNGDRRMVELELEDTGRGIPPEDLPHLFEPFFTTKGNKGTGLSLSVTWSIMEGHAGSIEVQSEFGKGTTFTVRLPVADNPTDSLRLSQNPIRGNQP